MCLSPGDYLGPDEEEIDGFKQRLNDRLAPVGNQFSGEGVNDDWEVGDTLAQWWRPNFETYMYPYIPGHVSRPKECKKLYFIRLPKKSELNHCGTIFLDDSLANSLLSSRGSFGAKEHETASCTSVRAV